MIVICFFVFFIKFEESSSLTIVFACFSYIVFGFVCVFYRNLFRVFVIANNLLKTLNIVPCIEEKWNKSYSRGEAINIEHSIIQKSNWNVYWYWRFYLKTHYCLDHAINLSPVTSIFVTKRTRPEGRSNTVRTASPVGGSAASDWQTVKASSVVRSGGSHHRVSLVGGISI